MLERTPHAFVPSADGGRSSAGLASNHLKVTGLTLEVDGKRLVNDVNLELAPASFTVVMGPNGAGKSLLLRLLHGLVAPTSGEIHWGGRPLDDGLRKRQAMVFQRPVLLRRSVAANIDFVLKGSGRARRQRLQEILERTGFLAQAKQPARSLSGGEQQRLALARALALEPEILLLDEPSASLDPAAVAAIEEIVRGAHAQGAKVIFVTHDLGQAKRLADDIVFMHGGFLEEFAPAEQFFSKPRTEAARAFLDGRLTY